MNQNRTPAAPRAVDVPALWAWLATLPATLRVHALNTAAALYLPGGAR